MQADILSEASQKAARQRLRTIYTAVLIFGIGVVSVLLIRYIATPSTTTSPDHADVRPGTVATGPETPGEDKRLRQEFMSMLQQYETETEHLLSSANLAAWNDAAERSIHRLKQESLRYFGQGNHAAAIDSLQKTSALAEKILDEWKRNYEKAYASALKNFHEAFPQQAKLDIESALVYKPDDADALELRRRILVLPKIKKLMTEAEIAQTENNLERKVSILEEILRLDPAREDARTEIERLGQIIAQDEYAHHIRQGLASVEKRDLAEARKSLKQARSLYPSRPETGILSARVRSLEKELSLQTSLKLGKRASGRDDWNTALKIYSDALAIHPDNPELARLQKEAGRIVALDTGITNHIKAHHRLSSVNVYEQAQKTLAEASAYTSSSRTLADKHGQLTDLLAGYGRNVDVVIRSDSQTYITVRGVGKVGKVSEKTIRLRPGNYTLEGRREGYRSKLVRLAVNPGQDIVSIKVVCDEQI